MATALKKEERLLLLACSGDKRETPNGEELAPIELYTGAMYTVLKKWMPRLDKAEIRILSAKHGLVTDEWPRLTGYNERLTAAKAQDLIERGISRPHTDPKRGTAPGTRPCEFLMPRNAPAYREIFLAAGAEYRLVFKAWILEMRARGWIAQDAEIIEVSGGIGEQRGQLGAWLRKISEPTDMKEAA